MKKKSTYKYPIRGTEMRPNSKITNNGNSAYGQKLANKKGTIAAGRLLKKIEMTLLTKLANRLTEMEGKSETVKELAKVFGCPYTSLYVPIKELEGCGFLELKRGTGVIIYSGSSLDEIKNISQKGSQC